MARGKVKHEYIDDKSSREVSFKKRKRGLKKKMTELSTLCGVEACAIIYDNLGTEDFTTFASYADQKMQEVQERISDLRGVPIPLLVAPSPVTDQPLMDRSKFITKCK
ncbi:hypothetical protein IFM89_000861 [Coptis chinensis]|uniref:MADS-box domain-containing protein n=1 Tax=Coptis chinensis TaxID=261450 RepID=A0A835II60_9MAGN|nr:hypothetical protein IFM89_000861 [Coptis chinensis]